MSLIPHCKRVKLRAGQMKAADQNILDPLPDKMVKFDLDVISKVIEVKIEVKLA